MAAGTLIIAGGALDLNAQTLFNRFVRAAGGSGKRCAVLPAGTAEPEAAFNLVARYLAAAGVPAEKLAMLHVSEKVAGWGKGAFDPATIAEAERSDGFWIPGGNQNAITRLLLNPDGTDTPLLATLRKRLDAGAVIGGTSAGAAVMSDLMIGGGTSFGALGLPRAACEGHTEISDALWVTRGLGFFPLGIIDQHFDSRARLGRLIEAVMVEGGARRPGFGIAEDSALVWNAVDSSVTAIGGGGVCIVDASNARRSVVNGQSCIRGVELHYLCRGDVWHPTTGSFSFADKKLLEPGNESFTAPKPEASGVLSGYGRLVDFVCAMLLDNKPECLSAGGEPGLLYAVSYLTGKREGERLGWEVRLGRASGRTQAWVGNGFGFSSVLVDIIPAKISIELVED